MAITKHNVCETINTFLKQEKIRYSISGQDSKGCLYELFVSSTSGFIQVEYNLDDEKDDYVILMLYTDIDNSGNSIYHSDWDNESEGNDSLEGEIEQLLDSVKRINQAIIKISTKIEQIRDICDEYELDFDEFITLNYDFNN